VQIVSHITCKQLKKNPNYNKEYHLYNTTECTDTATGTNNTHTHTHTVQCTVHNPNSFYVVRQHAKQYKTLLGKFEDRSVCARTNTASYMRIE